MVNGMLLVCRLFAKVKEISPAPQIVIFGKGVESGMCTCFVILLSGILDAVEKLR